ncbi:ABC transporter permease [Nocardia cyriacigeorgica]|uniref:ABC transporter permease n=1 Tax=Nocardia cyriacigeorgica TaxID=135487 RepID=UPI0018939C48|nr:ABC transporter permease [Nocardia cyriacigeorgica]MBF6341971.1 ABC transporter permease [Nocardia cyriacigeorgica]MBF6513070.1 ABC transporter permease [Nocardia cyriacigeorgica]
MTRFARLLLRRVALLIGLLATVFAAVDLLPGSTARAVLGRDATEAAVAAKERELGLDRALPVRFGDWLAGVLTGDFGQSARGRSVGELLAGTFPQTLLLGGLAFALTIVASLAFGAWWSIRPRGALGRVLQPSTTTAVAVPEFVVATLLILVFSLATGWLPAVTITGRSGFPISAEMLVLPVLALAIPQIGWNTRVVRAALADAARLPHVETAVLDGLPQRTVLTRHVLPFALPTIAASFATTVGMLLGGALVVETIFNYPGLGALLAASVADRDTTLMAAVVALTGVVIMVMLAAADAVRTWALRGRI